MSREFRLALLRDWKAKRRSALSTSPATTFRPASPQDLTRSWSLMGRINQKRTRPQDEPVPLERPRPGRAGADLPTVPRAEDLKESS